VLSKKKYISTSFYGDAREANDESKTKPNQRSKSVLHSPEPQLVFALMIAKAMQGERRSKSVLHSPEPQLVFALQR
jgi:hypothetical protein